MMLKRGVEGGGEGEEGGLGEGGGGGGLGEGGGGDGEGIAGQLQPAPPSFLGSHAGPRPTQLFGVDHVAHLH